MAVAAAAAAGVVSFCCCCCCTAVVIFGDEETLAAFTISTFFPFRLQTDEDSSRLSTYRSFEEIDDCFSFEDQDCDFCNELDNSSQDDGGGLDKLDTLHRRRDNDKIDRIFDPRRQSSFMELSGSGEQQQQQQQDEGLGFETISVVEDEEEDSDDVKNAWVKKDNHFPKKKSFLAKSIEVNNL